MSALFLSTQLQNMVNIVNMVLLIYKVKIIPKISESELNMNICENVSSQNIE